MTHLAFFAWYYREGARNGFSNVKNLLRAVLHRFNTRELALTLFAPWKRDIEYRTWRGFHPLRAFVRFIDNTLSRFMGMWVRLPVVLYGFAYLCVALVISFAVYVWYLGAPLCLLIGLYGFFTGFSLAPVLVLAGIFGMLFGFLCFLMRTPELEVIGNIDFLALQKKPWFYRVLARLEMDIKDIPADALANVRAFMALLKIRNIDEETLAIALDIEQRAFVRQARAKRFWLWENLEKKTPLGKGWRFGYTPRLDRYCLDLSQEDPTEYRSMELIGRQAEFRVATVVLERPEQNNIFLVGEPGIGKKMFVHYLARLIRESAFPKNSSLNDLRVLLFDLEEAIGEILNRGENPEDTLRGLFFEAASAGNVLLVVEDVDLFLGTDPQKLNIAHLLNEFLALPSFRFIGTAVAARYHALAKKDEQILKLFETIYLRQPNVAENREILVQFFAQSERRQVVLTLKAIETIIMSSRRYNWEMPYPERVLDLAQQVMIYFRNQPGRFLTEKVVNEYVSMKTGMPIGEVGADEQKKLLNLETELHERVIGQNEAVNQVSQVLRKARAGFHDPKRPLGSFLFMGPTGVGKTETVKALAESIFGDEEKMFRIDMSEFQIPNSLERLLGSQADGLPGILTKAMKEHPYCILLLDEIEKAYPKILDVFLQIIDEGMVTDSFGEKINFRNAIIIATSNAGSVLIKELSEQGIPLNVLRKQVIDQVVHEGIFRIEFMNRFDNLIFFEPLSAPQLTDIAELKLKKFVDQIKAEKNIEVVIAPGVTERIVAHGYEPQFGARSVNRYIMDHIEDIVVRKVISGAVKSGGSVIIGPEDI
jgi:ATP-dependent Clp protease ATP-binding subunit ClpC